MAEFLEGRPEVERVYYPGLKNHPGREVQRGQARGAGSVLSFTTGDAELSRRFVESVRLFDIAVSFGSVHSSVSLPCHMSHASIPPSARERLAPPPDLVRVSVGIEDAEDLLADLEQAFHAARRQEAKAQPVAYVGA